MAQKTVIKSFAELADVLGEYERTTAANPERNGYVTPANVSEETPDLDVLIIELEAATAALSTIAHHEEAVRVRALRDLERYDAVINQQCEAKDICRRARETRLRAEQLAARSLTDEDQSAATQVVETSARVEHGAEQLATLHRQERERLASDPCLARALEQRARQQAEEQTRAAEAQRSQRLASALAEARTALEAGQVEQATEFLGPLVKEYPNNSDVASLEQMIARYTRNVKASAIEDVLWEARRVARRDPATAVTRLERVDLDGLPEPLARQVFGEWARACARLCRMRGFTEVLRYAPNPGRGAVIAPSGSSGAYIVVGSIGMGPTWTPGSAVGDSVVRRARPLR
jgi:hypothetical protein